MSVPHLLTSIDGPVATIRFNRPELRNALSPAMLEAMFAFVSAITLDRRVRCLVITGSGDHFMSGGDVSSFAEALDRTATEREAEFTRRARSALPVFAALERFPGPIIAKVRGAVAGAGIGWVAEADLVLTSDEAFFVFAHVRLGLSPDGGLSHFLPRLVGSRQATEWLLLGRRIDAAEALAAGLTTRIVAERDLDSETDELARLVSRAPARAIASTRRLLAESHRYSRAEQMEREAAAFGACAATDDFVDGVRAFLDRTPRSVEKRLAPDQL